MTLKRLSTEDIPEIKKLFRSVFSNPPWNEDWSDDKQLTAYITDLAGCFNSVCYGYLDGETMIGVSLGNKRHWYGGTDRPCQLFQATVRKIKYCYGRKNTFATDNENNVCTKVFFV